jgi:hypothetical protein
MTFDHSSRGCVRSVLDPSDLAELTRGGLLWTTPLAQHSVNAVIDGRVPLDECENIPDAMRAFLEQGLADKAEARRR